MLVLYRVFLGGESSRVNRLCTRASMLHRGSQSSLFAVSGLS
jgi:hypothetical protein